MDDIFTTYRAWLLQSKFYSAGPVLIRTNDGHMFTTGAVVLVLLSHILKKHRTGGVEL